MSEIPTVEPQGQHSSLALVTASAANYPLATKSGLELMIEIFLHTGAMCPKCAFGTRATSKKWATCKKCGERYERKTLPQNNPVSESAQPTSL